MEWYLILQGRQCGPYQRGELLSVGLSNDTPVWTEGMETPLPAKDVGDLQRVLKELSWMARGAKTDSDGVYVMPRLSFLQAVNQGLGNLFNVKGRARRSEYWWFSLFLFLLSGIVLGLVDGVVYELLVFTGLSVPIEIRRLHDIGNNAKCLIYCYALLTTTIVIGMLMRIYSFQWLGYLCILFMALTGGGAVYLIVQFVKNSETEENEWGPSPKYLGVHDFDM
ncbi:MAG: DUF805 domain-containing protein [Muribaculaceae bacterium]|nr:DUF805 domain-containing protein [Muribaculaceae bacterium]